MKRVFCNQGQREVRKVGLLERAWRSRWFGSPVSTGLEPDQGQLTLRAMFRAALQTTIAGPPASGGIHRVA